MSSTANTDTSRGEYAEQPDPERFRTYAHQKLGEALEALNVEGDPGADLDVLAPLELALMASSMYYASLGPITLIPSDVVEYVDEPEPKCTCPPGLVERGGFASGCPVHA